MKLAQALFLTAILATTCCGDGAPGAGGTEDTDAAVEPAEPFADFEAGTWGFWQVDDMTCMDGSSTGFAVNPGARTDRLLLLLQGGGACFNGFSCNVVGNQDGFGPAKLAQYAAGNGQRGVFDRDAASNPFRDWTYVMVPYCSGDLHAGSAPEGFGGRVQVGWSNVGEVLERVVPELEGEVEEVVLAGVSAGGFGALLNYERVQAAFGEVPVQMLSDSAPPLADDYLNPCLQAQLREVWNLDPNLPADCDGCFDDTGGSFTKLVEFYASAYPQRRFAYVASDRDETIRQFYGFGYPSCEMPTVPMPAEPYASGVHELAGRTGSLENTSAFVVSSTVHTWLHQLDEAPVVDGTALSSWLQAFASGDERWDDVVDVVD